MWLRLRQICLVARELAPPRADLEAVFGLAVCHSDSAVHKYGLENCLLPVGNQLLEIVAPTREGTAAGRYLERRGGDGGYMVITQCDDLDPRRARVDALGVRIANPLDYEDYRGMQLHPRDTGGSFFEIDFQEGGEAIDGPWHPAGPDWQAYRRTDRVDAIPAVELQSAAPEALARRWAEIAEIDLAGGGDRWILPLENAELHFVPDRDGRGDGLSALHLRVRDEAAVRATARERGLVDDGGVITICGTRFHLAPA